MDEGNRLTEYWLGLETFSYGQDLQKSFDIFCLLTIMFTISAKTTIKYDTVKYEFQA